MKRVLLLLPTTGYRNNDFVAAARKLGVEIVAAANYCHRLAPSWGLPPIMALHFDQPEQAADAVLRELDGTLDAVLAVDDSGVELAALLAERLGLPGNPARRGAPGARQAGVPPAAPGAAVPVSRIPSPADRRRPPEAGSRLEVSGGGEGAAFVGQPRRDPCR